MQARRWQDGMSVFFGLWLFASPWILGFRSEVPGHGWNFFIVGLAMIAFALMAMKARVLWAEWGSLALGIWLVISPWILRFSANTGARDDAIVLGVLAILVSIWAHFEHRGTARVRDTSTAVG